MKKTKKNPALNQPTPSALKTVGALGEELARLSKQLTDTAEEITETVEPSRLFALEKLNQQRSANFARLVKSALAAEKELGLLVEKSEVDAAWTRTLIEFRKTLEQLSRRIATKPLFKELDPVDVELVIRREIDTAVHQLYQNSGGTEPLPPALK